MAKPAVLTPTQISIAQGYTVGNPDKTPEAATLALAPLIGSLSRSKFPVLCGVDIQSGSTAFAPGTSTSFSILIALPNLPSFPFVVGTSDTAQFVVGLTSIVLPGTDTLTAITITPQAYTQTGTLPLTSNGGVLRSGASYTGWAALVNGVAQGSSNGTIIVGVTAALYDTVFSQ